MRATLSYDPYGLIPGHVMAYEERDGRAESGREGNINRSVNDAEQVLPPIVSTDAGTAQATM
jgi:hypothetical protein